MPPPKKTADLLPSFRDTSLLPRRFHTSEADRGIGHINVNVPLSSESLGNPKNILVDEKIMDIFGNF